MALDGYTLIISIYAFQKRGEAKEDGLIECAEDSNNGNLEWMCANGYTTGKEEQKKLKQSEATT